MTDVTKSDSRSPSESLWARHVKPGLRKVRYSILGDPRKLRIKPINYWNSLYWIKRTVNTDLKHYTKPQRALSAHRFFKSLYPAVQNPIFIVGSPRSGTTFLGNCIAEIPEISYHFEPVLTKAAARYVYEQLWSQPKSEWLYKATYRWLMRIHLDGDLRFAEKTPQTSFIVPFLANIFPDAKFIHILRDGRDVAISLAEKPWHRLDKKESTQRDPDGYLCGPWSRFWVEANRNDEFETTNDIHRCVWIWRRHVEEVLRASENLSPKQYHELKYENLVSTPIDECEKLLNFLNISDSESRKIFQDVLVSRAKSSSVARWKSTFSDEQIAQVNREIGSLMGQLGYTT